MASFGAMSFTLSKHQGSLNRSRTVQQNNELMEALSPSQSDQGLNLVIGSRSTFRPFKRRQNRFNSPSAVMTQKAPQLKPRPVHTPPKRDALTTEGFNGQANARKWRVSHLKEGESTHRS